MFAAVLKMEPKSEGIATPRKKRPKEIAVVTECCTGCAGSPIEHVEAGIGVKMPA